MISQNYIFYGYMYCLSKVLLKTDIFPKFVTFIILDDSVLLGLHFRKCPKDLYATENFLTYKEML